MIDKVQICATKLTAGMKELPYETRFQLLNLPTLVYKLQGINSD